MEQAYCLKISHLDDKQEVSTSVYFNIIQFIQRLEIPLIL